MRDFRLSVIIILALPELGVRRESTRQDYRPCSSSNSSSRLQLPNHAAFWSSLADRDMHTYTLAAAVEIRWTARRTQLKRRPLIEVFFRSALVLRGSSPQSSKGQLLGPAAASSFFFVSQSLIRAQSNTSHQRQVPSAKTRWN